VEGAAARIREARERDELAAEAEQPPEEEEAAEEEERPAETPEPEPPEPTPEEQARFEQIAELEKAQARYLKQVEKILGPDGMPPVCARCEGTGLDFTGGEPEPEFREHEQYKTCPDCEGWGQVKTGSRVTGHALQDCPRCTGRGYLERLQAVPGPVPAEEQYGTPSWMGTVQPPSGP
jgi:hypothetical protein